MAHDNSKSSLYEGHRQRLKKRFLHDPDYMEDYEFLELLLSYALPRKDTKPLAKSLLTRFGSLRRVLDAKKEELLNVEGFGMGTWTLWQVIRQCMARHSIAVILDKEVLATSENIAAAAQKQLANQTVEECWLATLDKGRHCTTWRMLARGSIDNIAVTPRDVIEAALSVKAAGFILVHNHPGGSPLPSRADTTLTALLKHDASRIGLDFVEHLIITDHRCRSLLAQRDIIPAHKSDY